MFKSLLFFLPDTFQFAHGPWLWGLLALPVIWMLFVLFYRGGKSTQDKLKEFADPHLLPHLLEDVDHEKEKTAKPWRAVLSWSLIWGLCILALAGPRWNYTQVKAFSPANYLVFVLDMSLSMDAQDIEPSRLARAKEEIEDLLDAGTGVKFSLITFDATAHMITPLTDDTETLRRLLPSLTSGIVYKQGAALAPALEMAAGMLSDIPGENKHVLILSDGGFDSSDADIYRATRDLIKTGAKLDGLGFGTLQGAPIPGGGAGFLKDKNGQTVISHLDEKRFRQIVDDGGGIYQRASYLSDDTNAILAQIKTLGAAAEKEQKTTIFWDEKFYIFLIPILLIFLPWLRRNASFPVLLAAFIIAQNSTPAYAFDWKDMFLNKQQQAAREIKEQKYDEAVNKFDDPYQKGVAQYRAGDYKAAAQSFGQSGRPEIQDRARYNLGNAQLMSGQIKDAIKTYEDLLKKSPDNEDAKHNLEIAKKLLEQQKQQQQNSQQNQNHEQKKQNNGQSGNTGQQGDQKNNNHQKEGQNAQQGQQSGSNNDDQRNRKQAESEKSNKQSEEQKSKQEEQSESTGERDKSDQEQQDSGHKSQSVKEENGNEQNKRDNDMGQNQFEPQDQSNRNPINSQNGQTQTRGRPRTQKDINADQWLERMESRPEQFLKNKFYIESKRAGAQQGEKPW